MLAENVDWSNLQFWVYSTLAQVHAALWALIGVFTVYRLQDQREKISDAVSDARTALVNEMGIKPACVTILSRDAVIGELQARMEAGHHGSENASFFMDFIQKRIDGEEWVRHKFCGPLLFNGLALGWMIFMLCDHIFMDVDAWAGILLTGSALFSLVTILISGYFVWDIIFAEQSR